MKDKSTVKLVLLSGDGNDNNGRPTNFPEIVHDALDQGFRVDVWAWKYCLSGVYWDLSVQTRAPKRWFSVADISTYSN